MVKKLFKHEFIAYVRVMVFVYAILLTVAAAGRIIRFFEYDSVVYKILNAFSGIAYAFTIGASLLFLFAFAVVRFYKNLFTHEGYLSFTLPVTQTQHILVKTMTQLCFAGITWVVILFSGCIFTAGDLLTEILKTLAYLLELCLKQALFQTISIGLEIVLLLVVISISDILVYYTFIAIGQLFKKNRILASVGVYFIYYIGVQFISTVFSILFSVFALTPVWYKVLTFIGNHPFFAIHTGMWVAIILTSAWAVACFIVIRQIITRKLNLE